MRRAIIVLSMLFGFIAPASAQVSISINLQSYPELVPVPGYPVYYSPRLHSNYFFYDGLYWIYLGDSWYESDWYNGPWEWIEPEFVPFYVLRIPVRYYRAPPAYFRGWRRDAPPRWEQRWGDDWARRRQGWDRWDRRAVPARAPLPVYQRAYTGARYPRGEQQQALRARNYDYRPRDALVQQHYRQAPANQRPSPPASPGPQPPANPRNPGQHDRQGINPPRPMPPGMQPQEERGRGARAEPPGNAEQYNRRPPQVEQQHAPPPAAQRPPPVQAAPPPHGMQPRDERGRAARAEPPGNVEQYNRRPPQVEQQHAPPPAAQRPPPVQAAPPPGPRPEPAARDQPRPQAKPAQEKENPRNEQENRRQER